MERFGREARIPLLVNDLILHLNRMVYEEENPAKVKEQEISERGKRSYMLLAKDGILLSNEELEEICGLDLKMPREAYVTDKKYYVLRQEMEKADCSVLSVSEYNGIMDLKSGLVLFVILFCIFLVFLICPI